MGSVLAEALLSKGHDVTVWNRTAYKTEPLVAAGAVVAESLWSTFKHEHYYRHTYATKSELIAAVDNWINFYNKRHSVIGMVSPIEYELSLQAAPTEPHNPRPPFGGNLNLRVAPAGCPTTPGPDVSHKSPWRLRPHSALNYQAPARYAANCVHR